MAKILIVDPQPLNRGFLRTLLQHQFHQVLEARDGKEALSLAQQEQPDLIITDLVLPAIDSLEFMTRLREDEALAQIPVIFYTASYKVKEAQQLADACGVNQLLFKPCKPQHILDHINQALLAVPKFSDQSPPEALPRLTHTCLHLTTLSESCLDISGERDPQRLLDKFCHSARELVDAKTAVLILNQEPLLGFVSQRSGERVLNLKDSEDWRDRLKSLFAEQPVVCLNPIPDGQLPSESLPSRPIHLLGVALYSQDKAYGWLCCFDKTVGESFDEQDQQMLQTLATQVGQLYENLGMSSQIEIQASELRHQNSLLQRTQASQNEGRERLKLATMAGGIGIWDYQIETQKLICSPLMHEMYDLPFEAGLDDYRAFRDRIHPEDLPLLQQRFQATIVHNHRFQVEFRIVWGDGSVRSVDVQARLHTHPDGSPFRILGVSTDITERKQAEAEIRRSKAEIQASHHQLESMVGLLQVANHTKSEFLTNMNHELRTPLNGVIGMSQLLLETPLSPQQHKFARIIAQSGRTLLHLINDILDFSRIEARTVKLEHKEFDLRELIQQTRALIEPELEHKALSLHLSLEDEVPTRVKGDARRLQQILLILLGNAVKFTVRGQIELRISCESGSDEILDAPAIALATAQSTGLPGEQIIEQTENQISLRFEILDTGIGISPDQLENIFRPFTQADGSTTRKFGGTGLGLSIARHLVRYMGGCLSCESQLGQGSAFYFTLTLSAVGACEPPTDSPSSAAPPRILLVEDNPINQAVAEAVLLKLGYQVTCVENGREALNALDQIAYDLVLMDCQMPVMDGYEATRRIRRGDAGAASIPIIAITAHVLDTDRAKCRHAGMDDYLAKPFDAVDLAQIVAHWLLKRDDPRVRGFHLGGGHPA